MPFKRASHHWNSTRVSSPELSIFFYRTIKDFIHKIPGEINWLPDRNLNHGIVNYNINPHLQRASAQPTSVKPIISRLPYIKPSVKWKQSILGSMWKSSYRFCSKLAWKTHWSLEKLSVNMYISCILLPTQLTGHPTIHRISVTVSVSCSEALDGCCNILCLSSCRGTHLNRVYVCCSMTQIQISSVTWSFSTPQPKLDTPNASKL